MPGLSDDALQALSCWLPASHCFNGAQAIRSEDIYSNYLIEKTAKVISEYATGNEFYVALQFPDHMLQVGPFICETLRLLTNSQKGGREDYPAINFFMLGDTSYGECCVDEVAAQHISCDLIVHYGNTCLSPTRTLPVLYVFPRTVLEHPQNACSIFEESIQEVTRTADTRTIIILYDLELEGCFTREGFQAGDQQVTLASLEVEVDIQVAALRISNADKIRAPGTVTTNGDDGETVVGPHKILLGSEPANKTVIVWYTLREEGEGISPPLRNAAIQLCTGASNSSRRFFSVSLTGERRNSAQVIDTSRILRKRFAAVSKIRDAERIGIIPGTLGVSGNTDIIERCRVLVNLAGKRSYVILVGKPNPVKLANYPEVDVFVLVACPQNGLINDKEYLRPIVTPFELEAAILKEGDIFSSVYTMDFQELLKESLCMADDSDKEERQLISRSSNWSLAVVGDSSGADYLKTRNWQGLKYGEGGPNDDIRVEDLPTSIQTGESGIASGYSRELDVNHASKE